MTIKQRREREKQEIRQAILLAARQIALQDGWQAVTIRKVADRIEYSPPTIYEYFASKEDILLVLHEEGFRLLGMALRAARELGKDPQERLLNVAEAYWDFAMEHLELYQVMFGIGGAPFDCRNESATWREVCNTKQEVLNDWARAVGMDVSVLQGALPTMGGLVHGLVSLTVVNRINGGAPEAKKLLRQALSDLLFAWSKRGGG